MLIKLTVSSGLHYCRDPKISFYIAAFLLNNPGAVPAFNALLLSVATRSFAPDLLDHLPQTVAVRCDRITAMIDKDEQLYDALTASF